MTPEEPMDDKIFITSNLPQMGRYGSGRQNHHDQSSFTRIGNITGRCPAECSSGEATSSIIVGTDGLGSAQFEGAGPGVW
jgi:hypothetical protein